jgi:hypothetical protein
MVAHFKGDYQLQMTDDALFSQEDSSTNSAVGATFMVAHYMGGLQITDDG